MRSEKGRETRISNQGDKGLRTKDQGPRTKDKGPRTKDQGPIIRNKADPKSVCSGNMFAGKRSVPVWAVHYPPNYDYGNKRRTTEHRLNGEEDLVAAARRCEVPLILAGHSHKHRYYPNGIVTPFTFCAGTSSQVGPAVPGNYCHIISFDIDDSDYQYSVKHFRFDPIAGDFQYVDEEGDSQV
jgi:hypothetical protein